MQWGTGIVAATAKDIRGKKEAYRSECCLGGYWSLRKWLEIFIIESNGNSDAEKGNLCGWNFGWRIWMDIFDWKLERIRSVCLCACGDVVECECMFIGRCMCMLLSFMEAKACYMWLSSCYIALRELLFMAPSDHSKTTTVHVLIVHCILGYAHIMTRAKRANCNPEKAAWNL